MTICCAALAAESRVIVCIADKALSYGDEIQWDSDSTKIVKLNDSGPLLMFAGDEDHTSKVLAAIIGDAENLRAKKTQHIIDTCERLYKEAVDELVEAKFLTPRLLKREDYLAAIKSPQVNSYILNVAKEVDAFRMNCDILLCGFDVEWKPFILDLSHPGIIIDMTHTGFHAIGSGWEKAVSKLLFVEHKRDHSVSRTLYDSFDAKAFAEMSKGVGFEWDAIVAMSGIVKFCDITKEIKGIVERAWSKFNRSPFDKYDKEEDLLPPPRNWKGRLDKLMESQVLSKLSKMEKERDEIEKG